MSTDATWDQLLGAGVRGTTAREVLRLVRAAGGRPTLLPADAPRLRRRRRRLVRLLGGPGGPSRQARDARRLQRGQPGHPRAVRARTSTSPCRRHQDRPDGDDWTESTIAEATTTTIDHPDGRVLIDELPGGLQYVTVEVADPQAFVPSRSCVSSLPIGLIEAVLAFKGPAQLCYSLRREEDPLDVQVILRYAILGYVEEAALAGRRLLDFGCGSGASTMILARMP